VWKKVNSRHLTQQSLDPVLEMKPRNPVGTITFLLVTSGTDERLLCYWRHDQCRKVEMGSTLHYSQPPLVPEQVRSPFVYEFERGDKYNRTRNMSPLRSLATVSH
jgi:hypothetical protein